MIVERLEIPYYTLEPEGCINCGFEAINLANIILERNRGYSYSYNTLSVGRLSALLRSTQSPLSRHSRSIRTRPDDFA
jgi:hypothetical protein